MGRSEQGTAAPLYWPSYQHLEAAARPLCPGSSGLGTWLDQARVVRRARPLVLRSILATGFGRARPLVTRSSTHERRSGEVDVGGPDSGKEEALAPCRPTTG